MKYLTLLGLPGLVMAIASHQLTPLHMAVEGKHLGTVKYLVGQGADTNVKDGNGVSTTTVVLTVDYCIARKFRGVKFSQGKIFSFD